MTPSGIAINNTNFPDENFSNYLLKDYSYGEDGVLLKDEIESITFLDVSWKNISSLKGIEYFTALKELDCSFNNITSLDLSKNTALDYLNCSSNQLTSLDVSKNTALKNLECYDNYINGLAMNALVNSLNNHDTSEKDFRVIYLKEGDENVCTKSQVAIAKGKGWNVLDSYWDDYEGSDDTPSGIQMMSQEEWAKDNWFDLQGRRISKPTAKGVYINNGNKVMVK